MLLASANEVSYAVAENVGKQYLNGGYAEFIEEMNRISQELGCTSSNWVNANGLHDDNHYTTAHDMARIAAAAIRMKSSKTGDNAGIQSSTDESDCGRKDSGSES